MASEPEPPVMTNIHTSLAITKEAFAKSEEIGARQTRPRPGGGFVVTWDPNQTSFKHSLIAIVFAAVYLEALLYQQGTKLLGRVAYKKVDGKSYEEKLQALGVTDQGLLDAAKEFRRARRELVHEKAHDNTSIRIAQGESAKALALIDRVRRALRELGKR
jgi:hypothetical protein